MVITKRALPRRTFIRGMGATLALPLLDAMVPAMSAQSKTAKAAPRFAAIYCGNGATMNDWTPATEGTGFAFSPTLKPLEAFRDKFTTELSTGSRRIVDLTCILAGGTGAAFGRAIGRFAGVVQGRTRGFGECRRAAR